MKSVPTKKARNIFKSVGTKSELVIGVKNILIDSRYRCLSHKLVRILLEWDIR